jgi:hypothetical protein
MKSLFAGLVVMTLATLTGCSQGTPGGPGTTEKKPAFGQADDTFNLSVPVLSSSVQQGEQTEATVGIERAKNFDEDVALTFADIPKGVTVEPASPVIKHGDTDAKITFKVGDEAPVGDFKVNVTGHPTKGSDAQIAFKLTIAVKDSFTLSTPSLSTSLKQGETQTVVIGIKRDKSFDQDVALTFGDMPTGVTLQPLSPVIKQGDAEVRVTLTGADDASLGNFAIKVTGHPAKGADASNELKLTVAKKSGKEHAAVVAGTPGPAANETDIATHDGTLVSITGANLVMTNKAGIEHSHALTADAKLTLDRKTCTAADLKPGMKIRVTLQSDAPHAAIHIEAIDKNSEFASLQGSQEIR